MPLSLYRRLGLNKLTPTKISLQMADKSTAIPVGICEDMPAVVANVTISTDFVILDIPEDNGMSIILGRPFLNMQGLLMGMSIRYISRRNNLKFIVSILLEKFQLLLLEVFNSLFLLSKRNMVFLLLGTCISSLR